MKIKYLKLKNWLLLSLGGLLGLNVSCAVMYGTPTSYYHIKGTVMDQNDQPAVGIGIDRVISSDGRDTTYSAITDSHGRFSLDFTRGFADNFTRVVHFTDADGEENGQFADTTWGVEFKASDLQGGDGNWDEGTATKTVVFPIRKIESE